MDYRIIHSRRKTLAIEITPLGEILVRAPLRMPQRDIRKFLEEKKGWISSHLAALPEVPPLTPQQHQALIRSAREYFPEQSARYASQMHVTFGRIAIRSQHTRWGSCSAQGNLNFNCLLMLAPEAVREYVIVHELCHRKHMNHSPGFWSEVEGILPDYRVRKQWLKENGSRLLARLPRTHSAQK